MNINPMNLAPRCRAHSKRTKQPCKAPAVKGWRVCYKHGAGGGAPEREANGNFKHGGYSKDTKAALATLRALARLCRETLNSLPD